MTEDRSLVGTQKAMTARTIREAGADADRQIADTLCSALHEVVDFAQRESVTIDWPTIDLRIDITSDFGGALLIKWAMRAEPHEEGVETTLNRALADAVRRASDPTGGD